MKNQYIVSCDYSEYTQQGEMANVTAIECSLTKQELTDLLNSQVAAASALLNQAETRLAQLSNLLGDADFENEEMSPNAKEFTALFDKNKEDIDKFEHFLIENCFLNLNELIQSNNYKVQTIQEWFATKVKNK